MREEKETLYRHSVLEKNQPLSSWKKIVVVVYLHIACFHYVVGIDRDGSRITDIFRASRKISNTDHAAQRE